MFYSISLDMKIITFMEDLKNHVPMTDPIAVFSSLSELECHRNCSRRQDCEYLMHSDNSSSSCKLFDKRAACWGLKVESKNVLYTKN